MKKLFILILLAGIPFLSSAQSCDKTAAASCDKTSCGPEGTKKGEAKVITPARIARWVFEDNYLNMGIIIELRFAAGLARSL